MEFSRRKWGWYLTLYSESRFKIKLLYFKPGHSCSMQRHKKRSEIWCFLFGKGEMFLNRRKRQVTKGSSVIVAAGDWHQYVAGTRTLVLEVQTGTCRESDIERAD